MARADWRKYYVLTFSDGTCSPYFYRNLGKLRRTIERVCGSARRAGVRPSITGILHVKGKTPAAQQAMYARCIGQEE